MEREVNKMCKLKVDRFYVDRDGHNDLDGSLYILSFSVFMFVTMLLIALWGCTMVRIPIGEKHATYVTWFQDRHLTVTKDPTKTTLEYSTDNDPAVKVAKITADAVVSGIKEGRETETKNTEIGGE
jgi:hypothetical protein